MGKSVDESMDRPMKNTRLGLFVLVSVGTAVVLGLAISLNNRFSSTEIHDFLLFSIIVTIITLVAFIILAIRPNRRIDLVVIFVLAVLWLSMGAYSQDVIGGVRCYAMRGQNMPANNGSNYSAESYCRQIKAILAFSWANFVFLTLGFFYFIYSFNEAQGRDNRDSWRRSISPEDGFQGGQVPPQFPPQTAQFPTQPVQQYVYPGSTQNSRGAPAYMYYPNSNSRRGSGSGSHSQTQIIQQVYQIFVLGIFLSTNWIVVATWPFCGHSGRSGHPSSWERRVSLKKIPDSLVYWCVVLIVSMLQSNDPQLLLERLTCTLARSASLQGCYDRCRVHPGFQGRLTGRAQYRLHEQAASTRRRAAHHSPCFHTFLIRLKQHLTSLCTQILDDLHETSLLIFNSMGHLFRKVRLGLFGLIFAGAGVVLGISINLAVHLLPTALHDYLLFSIVVSALTLVVFILLALRSQPRIDAAILFVLAVLWLTMGAYSQDVIGSQFCYALRGQTMPAKNDTTFSAENYCRQMKAVLAFSWANFVFLSAGLIGLLAVVFKLHARGNRDIWRNSISDVSLFNEKEPAVPHQYPGGPHEYPTGSHSGRNGQTYVYYPGSGNGAPLQHQVIQQQPGHSVIIQNGQVTQVPGSVTSA